MSKRVKIILIVVFGVVMLAAIGGIVVGIIGLVSRNFTQEISFQVFLDKIRAGEIDRLYVDGYRWTGEVWNANGVIVDRYTAVGPSIYNYADFSEFFSRNYIDGTKCPTPIFRDGLDKNGYIVALIISCIVLVVDLVGGLLFISTRKIKVLGKNNENFRNKTR